MRRTQRRSMKNIRIMVRRKSVNRQLAQIGKLTFCLSGCHLPTLVFLWHDEKWRNLLQIKESSFSNFIYCKQVSGGGIAENTPVDLRADKPQCYKEKS